MFPFISAARAGFRRVDDLYSSSHFGITSFWATTLHPGQVSIILSHTIMALFHQSSWIHFSGEKQGNGRFSLMQAHACLYLKDLEVKSFRSAPYHIWSYLNWSDLFLWVKIRTSIDFWGSFSYPCLALQLTPMQRKSCKINVVWKQKSKLIEVSL